MEDEKDRYIEELKKEIEELRGEVSAATLVIAQSFGLITSPLIRSMFAIISTIRPTSQAEKESIDRMADESVKKIKKEFLNMISRNKANDNESDNFIHGASRFSKRITKHLEDFKSNVD